MSGASPICFFKVGAVVKTQGGKKLGRIYAIDGGQTAVILKGDKVIRIAVSPLPEGGAAAYPALWVSRPGLSTVPGSAPLCWPPSIRMAPLTMTWSMPTASA